jgi:hypothetical protein
MTRTLFLLWLLQHKSKRCYMCRQVGLAGATYSEICWRHQLLISWRMFRLMMRNRRFFHGLWRLLRWWR